MASGQEIEVSQAPLPIPSFSDQAPFESVFKEGSLGLEAISCVVPKVDKDALRALCPNAVADQFYQECAKADLKAKDVGIVNLGFKVRELEWLRASDKASLLVEFKETLERLRPYGLYRQSHGLS
ncbi:hypothetical protein U1Q18_001931 [Sarracenia purpurea var. burkii]